MKMLPPAETTTRDGMLSNHSTADPADRQHLTAATGLEEIPGGSAFGEMTERAWYSSRSSIVSSQEDSGPRDASFNSVVSSSSLLGWNNSTVLLRAAVELATAPSPPFPTLVDSWSSSANRMWLQEEEHQGGMILDDHSTTATRIVSPLGEHQGQGRPSRGDNQMARTQNLLDVLDSVDRILSDDWDEEEMAVSSSDEGAVGFHENSYVAADNDISTTRGTHTPQ